MFRSRKNSYCSGTGHVIKITNEIRRFVDLEISRDSSSTGEVQLIRLMVRVSTYRPVLLLLRGPVGAMQVANYRLGAGMFIAISFSTAGPMLASTHWLVDQLCL